MNEPNLEQPSTCHKCGVLLIQDPIALRILARLDVSTRPSTCAVCAVDQGKGEKGQAK
jgi:hypothetical protein